MQAPVSLGHGHEHEHNDKNPHNECNIQGDAVLRLPKKREDFVFFNITNLDKFRDVLNTLTDSVTCVHDTKDARVLIHEVKKIPPSDSTKKTLLPFKFMNIAFSKDGIAKLGFNPEELQDKNFVNGQLNEAESLGDPGHIHQGQYVPDWDAEFLKPIDGLVLVVADSDETAVGSVEVLKKYLGTAAEIVHVLTGKVRTDPGEEKNEHFGWRDGISQPFLNGLSMGKPNNGQRVVDPGVIILGAKGDKLQADRPAWGRDGSFLVFRKLQQDVQKFKKFIHENPVTANGIPVEGGSALRCAQFFGRWKSGAPLETNPIKDPGVIDGEDVATNNNFVFKSGVQVPCPYSAHIRKMNPRDPNALGTSTLEETSIVRAGIAYGDDYREGENPPKDRGLAFVCYQSRIAMGFVKQQKDWANNQKFARAAATGGVAPGFDPIIGQAGGADRSTIDTNGKLLEGIPQFITPRGGGYFFSPSISTLRLFSATPE